MQGNRYVPEAVAANESSNQALGRFDDSGNEHSRVVAEVDATRAIAFAGLAIAEELRGVREELGKLARRSA